MAISSQVFVFVFLPLVFLASGVFLLLKKKWSTFASNILLVVASFVFYAWGDISGLRFLIVEGLVCYLLSLLIGKAKSHKVKKLFMIIAICFFIGSLSLYKYLPFVLNLFEIENEGSVSSFWGGAIPLGISFFTFSAVSYILDVYKEKIKCEKDFVKVILYFSFFGKITAGPIARYSEMESALRYRTLDLKETAYGIRRFVIGLAKKLLIANTLGLIVDSAYGMESGSITGDIARLGAFAYLLQIYFDFSGYSDMAIAIAQIFGFKIKENFNYPYAATSVKDFWRRWHISVSTWFRDYLYIPLGGNRKGRFRTCINKIIVFFFTGLWHGANFTYVLWGLWHGFFLLLEEYLGPITNKLFNKISIIKKILAYIYTMLVVYIGFAMFRAESLFQGFLFIGKIFASWGNPTSLLTGFANCINPFTFVITIIGIISVFPIKNFIIKKLGKYENTLEIVSFVYAGLLFVVCILFLATSTYNPFIYAQF